MVSITHTSTLGKALVKALSTGAEKSMIKLLVLVQAGGVERVPKRGKYSGTQQSDNLSSFVAYASIDTQHLLLIFLAIWISSLRDLPDLPDPPIELP